MSESEEEIAIRRKKPRAFDSDDESSNIEDPVPGKPSESKNDRLSDSIGTNENITSHEKINDAAHFDSGSESSRNSSQSSRKSTNYSSHNSSRRSAVRSSSPSMSSSSDYERENHSEPDSKSKTNNNNSNSINIVSNEACVSQVEPTPRRYKLLDEDDLSDGTDAERSSQKSDCNSCDTNASERTKTKRKNLQRKMKKLEKMRSDLKSCSDSENENNLPSTRTLKSKKRMRSKKLKKSGHRSECSNDSETESAKNCAKTNKISRQKQSKVDPMMEIKSETQKMIREGRIALPYHQPKKYSLEEFLERRRNKVSVPIKASLNVLNSIDERLLKREEELVEFYKSESEHSDNETGENSGVIVSKQLDLEPIESERESAKGNERLTEVDNLVENAGNSSLEGEKNAKIDQNLQDSNSDSFIDTSQTEQNVDELASCNTALSDQKKETFISRETNTIGTSLSQMLTESQPNEKDNATEIPLSADGIDQNIPPENNSPLPDTENFDLILQESIDETIIVKPPSGQSGEKQISEIEDTSSKNADKNDLRSKKLALLSRLNLPIRRNVGLNVSMDVVELDVDDARPKSDVSDFMEKFVAHVGINKTKIQSSSKSSVLTSDKKDSIEEEIVEVEERNVNIPTSKIKPGSKYVRFKSNMLKTIIIKKEADWETNQSRKENLFESREPIDEDSRDTDTFAKPNFEPYHPEEEPDDDELSEDDIIFKEKTLEKNDFVDDEAEVSYDEEENVGDGDVEDGDEDEDCEENSGTDVEDETKDDEEEDILDAENHENEEEEDTLSSSLNDNNFKKPSSQKISQIFKHNTTSDELENKVLGLDSITENDTGVSQITNSQIFGLCSGKFATQPDLLNTSTASDSENILDSQSVDDSQNFNLTLTDTNDELASKEVANDEFFTSVKKAPFKPSPLFLTDDESDTEELFAKKRKSLRIVESDDETNTIAQPINDEENELGDSNGEVEEQEDEFDDEFDYNSEEEVIVKEKAAEFFEQEAELSESEWGSEDENEKDLDELEKEAGDDDDIDEEKLKDELGRIHMRQMLDDDQHDVRALQELLLEDGELHSDSKRERKFQWKNLNDNGVWSTKDSDDERPLNEVDETDESWRKIRHEREMYIAQQEKKKDLLSNADDVDNNVVSLAKTSRLNSSTVPSRNPITPRSPNTKLPFQSKVVCGSFLAKGKRLNRLVITVNATNGGNVTGRGKNHRNFVFGTISPEKKLSSDEPVSEKCQAEKRKISNITSTTSKRVKFANDSTNVTVQSRFLAQLALTD